MSPTVFAQDDLRRTRRLLEQDLLKANIALAAPLLAFAAKTLGAVVLDGGAPNQQLLFASQAGTAFQTATTEVVLRGSASFDSLVWWGGYSAGAASPTDDFQLLVYSAANPFPAAPVVDVNLGTGDPVVTGQVLPFGGVEYRFASSFSSISLAAGTYYFGIQRSGGDPMSVWGWEQTSAGFQLGGGSVLPSGAFTPMATENLAFQAIGEVGAVPEPSTYLLMAAGLATLVVLGRRRRNDHEVAG